MNLHRLAAVLVCLAVTAPRAGENKYLGAIVVSASSATNASTASPFVIQPRAKLTINCTAAVNVLADASSTAASGATKGVPVPATTNFPTSEGQSLILIGGQKSALLAVFGTGTCDVWLRDGNE
jgi:hypothetical protein